jgi:peptidoglycan/LPS O-acetylase OafA/YrhL
MPAPPARQAASQPRRQFRPDIEGLRAIAVLGVVLFHAQLKALSGGYVGVDVFFVISGYLITGLLWREVEQTSRINLAAFYGRRARRLLPASILVIVVTAIASHYWLPPLEVPSVAKDGIAASLYVANYRFAITQTNYLNPASSLVSPYQHYWSLGVEEQFYLLWPLLLLAASVVWWYRHPYQRHRWRSNSQPSRATAMIVLSGVTVASFLLCDWLTHVNQPWAFFSLPTRAWELGAGGVLALATPTVRRLPRVGAEILGWTGLGVIVGSYFLISSSTPFPGTADLFPVAGTVAVLAAGQQAGPAGPIFLLGRPVMRLMGRISYSWYLWHWPFLVLAPYALGHALALWQNLLVAALSGLVAIASFLVVENPLRTWRWLAALPRRSLVTGGTLSATGVIACVVVATSVPSLVGHGVAPVAKLDPRAAARQAAARAAAPSAGPTTTVDPAVAQADALTAQVNAQVAASIGVMDVPANLTPSLADAGESNSPTFYDGCMDSFLQDNVEPCAFGDVGAKTSVVLFGDSHASMWFPAVDEAANQHGWQLFNIAKATCPPLYDVPIYSPDLGRNFVECDIWRQNALARIQQIHPALVILAMSRDYAPIYGFASYDQQWLTGLSRMVSVLRQMGSKVLVLGPVPIPPRIVYDCLSEHLTDAVACTWPVGQVVNEAGVAAERSVVTAAGGLYFDVQPWFCTAQRCGVIVGNILMWRDASHITEPYSAFLGPAMSAQLAEVLPSG